MPGVRLLSIHDWWVLTMKMKFLLLFILSLSTFVGVAQTNQQTKTPVHILYGERAPDERRHGPIISGILNMKVASEVLPAYPQKAKEKGLEGRVEVQVLVNEDGEVIFANPLSGPEGLWAESVRAAVGARFTPSTLSGEPVKITGRLIYDFKGGKVVMPYKKKS
jgi:TonB family protein